jgi:hypothetical protein
MRLERVDGQATKITHQNPPQRRTTPAPRRLVTLLNVHQLAVQVIPFADAVDVPRLIATDEAKLDAFLIRSPLYRAEAHVF